MSNYFPENEDVVDGYSDVEESVEGVRIDPHDMIPGPPDPGLSEDALKPLDPDERMRLERETDPLIHGGQRQYVEGEAGTASTGGMGGGLAGTRVGNASGPDGGSDLPNLETGRADLEDDEDEPRTGTEG